MKTALEIRDLMIICRDWFGASGNEMNEMILNEIIVELDAVVDYGVGGKSENQE